MEGKRVLVSGGSGVIGQELIQRLEKEGASVMSIDREPYPEDAPEVETVQSDLARDELDPIREFQPQIFFHLAAAFERTEESSSFCQENWHDNMRLTHRVLDELRDISTLETIVFASSYLVYDSDTYLSSTTPEQAKLIDEQTQKSPRNLCGAAKYYAEQELEFLADRTDDLRVVSPRIFRVYGRGTHDVISRWVRDALREREITVYNRENRFDYIHAGDVAEGLLRLAKAKQARGPVNLGYGKSRTMAEVLSVILDQMPGIEANLVDKGVQNLYEASCADITRLVKLTDWRPNYDLESGIKDVIKYERGRLE
jgi:nucleoside-diphosphate-sugar epimerase